MTEKLTIPRFSIDDEGFTDNLVYFKSITRGYFGGKSLFHKSSHHIYPFIPLLILKDIMKQFNLFLRLKHLKLEDSACNLKYPLHSPLNGTDYFHDPDQFPPNRNNAARIMSYFPKLNTFTDLETLKVFRLPISYTISKDITLQKLKELSLIGVTIHLNFFQILNDNLPQLIRLYFHNVTVHVVNKDNDRDYTKIDLNNLLKRLQVISIIDDDDNMHRGLYQLLVNAHQTPKIMESTDNSTIPLHECFKYDQVKNVQKERQTLRVIHYHPTTIQKCVSKYLQSTIFKQLNTLCINICFNNYSFIASLIQNCPELSDVCLNVGMSILKNNRQHIFVFVYILLITIDRSLWSNIAYDESFAMFMHSFMQKTSIENLIIKENLYNNSNHTKTKENDKNDFKSNLITAILKYVNENSKNTVFSLQTFVYISCKQLGNNNNTEQQYSSQSTIPMLRNESFSNRSLSSSLLPSLRLNPSISPITTTAILPPRPSALNFLYGSQQHSPRPFLQKIPTTISQQSNQNDSNEDKENKDNKTEHEGLPHKLSDFENSEEFTLIDVFSNIVNTYCMVRFDQIDPNQFGEIKDKFIAACKTKKIKIKICGDKEYLYDKNNENHYESEKIKVKLLYYKYDELHQSKFGDFEQCNFKCSLI